MDVVLLEFADDFGKYIEFVNLDTLEEVKDRMI